MPTDPWGGTVQGKKAGELVCTPASKLPQTFFPLPREKFRRHRRRQRTRLEARSGDEMTPFQTHPILSMDSYIQQPGSRPSREEPIQRSSRLGPQFHFAGKPHTGHNCSFLTGGTGEQPSRTRTKKQIDPIPSSRGPLCTQRSRPGPDRPGYRGTAPPFRRTPLPSGPRIGGTRRSAGNLFPGRICRWLRWPAGWTGLSRSERKKRRSTTRTGWAGGCGRAARGSIVSSRTTLPRPLRSRERGSRETVRATA